NGNPVAVPSMRLLLDGDETADIAAKKQMVLLFWRSSKRRRVGISAGKAMCSAVNLLQKQQKRQRPPLGPLCARAGESLIRPAPVQPEPLLGAVADPALEGLVDP